MSSGAITTSSFMPPGAAATLPRSLENGYLVDPQGHSQEMEAGARPQNVYSKFSGSPVLVDTHARTSMAMATMPRTLPQHTVNGNGSSGNYPPGAVEYWRNNAGINGGEGGSPATAVMGNGKKKSVTIGTFTTVVEQPLPFDTATTTTATVNGNSNGMESSAV